MIRFIHTADIHYGMENYGRIDPQTGIHTRLLDFDKAFTFCVETAITEKVDFFLISGDIYKTTNPSQTQQRLFFQALLKLHAANIPVIIVIGNHDNPLSFGKANTVDFLSDLPFETFHIITKPRAITIQTKNGPVQIVGIPWPTRNMLALHDDQHFAHVQALNTYISSAVCTIIKQLAENLDRSIPAVLSAHLTVDSGIFSGSEKRAVHGQDPLFMPSDLAIPPFDYVALGHLHRFQQLNGNNYPPVVYSGSPERIDFGERKEEKGFCLVTIQQKGTTTYDFIRTPQRPFIQIEATIQPNDTRRSATEQILDAIKPYRLDESIVKIIYHMESELSATNTVDVGAIQRACVKAHDLIGIFPVVKTKERTFRGSVSIEMDFVHVLKNYFVLNNIDAQQQERLIEKALMFKEQLAQQEITLDSNE